MRRQVGLLAVSVLLVAVLGTGCGPLFVIQYGEPEGGRASSQPPSLYGASSSIVSTDTAGTVTLASSVGVKARTTIANVTFRVTTPDGSTLNILATRVGKETYTATFPLPRGQGGAFTVVAIATTTDGASAQLTMPDPLRVPPGPPSSLL